MVRTEYEDSGSTRGAHEKRTGSKAHRSQRVDLFVHLHRTHFRRKGRSAPSRQNDCRHDGPQLAHHRQGDEIDHEDIHSKLAQRRSRLEEP